MTTAARRLDAAAATSALEIRVDARPERVWRTVTERPDEWWIDDLRCVPGGSEMSLDARAGGMLIERSRDGGSLLWFTVIAVEPGRSLHLAGSLAPPYGGPAQTFLWLALEEDGEATVVRMTHSLHGHVAEGSLAEMERGWRLLLEKGLKPAVEGGSA
ncbi:MAG: SRPBCC domain-containing protein [Planctomycetota bacterium JB042]